MVEYWIPSDVLFEHLRPKGKIIVGMDRKYWVPVINTNFNNFYEFSIPLWPKISAHSNYRLLIKTPTASSSDSSEEIRYDTAF